VKSDYCEQQKTVADEVVSIACGYIEPLYQLCNVIAHLDVLTSFAQVSAEAPVPYVRPSLLLKG
jgi:DNA mismatch repair protein MSH2